MRISPSSYANKEDFQNAAMSRFIDHMQRNGLKPAIAKRLKTIYVGVIALKEGWKHAKR